MMQEIAQWPKRKQVMLIQHLADHKQFLRRVPRLIESSCGPMHKLPVHRIRFRQTDPAMLFGITQRQNQSAQKRRMLQYIDIGVKFESWVHPKTLAKALNFINPQGLAALRYLRSPGC